MSTVYFTDLRTRPRRNLLDKISELLSRTKMDKKIKKNDLVAIKLHFGEPGNCAYVRPVFLRTIVDRVRLIGARPFLTDTNTLYSGPRSNGVTHIDTAVRNGFDYAVVGCPIVIADGIRSSSGATVAIPGEILDEVHIAREILEADGLIVVSHFKGHELSGFGGALKNMGMGCATREGKLLQHSTVRPRISVEKCEGCVPLPRLLPLKRHLPQGKEGLHRRAPVHRLRRVLRRVPNGCGGDRVERGPGEIPEEDGGARTGGPERKGGEGDLPQFPHADKSHVRLLSPQ